MDTIFNLEGTGEAPFGIVRNITISNVNVEANNFGGMNGNPNDIVSDVVFKDMNITTKDPAFKGNYKGIKFENVTVNNVSKGKMKRLAILFLCFIAIMNSVAMEKKNIPLYWISTSEEKLTNPIPGLLSVRILYSTKCLGKAIASIAADTKYWLWINGEPVSVRGGSSEGPIRMIPYYETKSTFPHTSKGENKIAVLLFWHFRKDGFSHVNSVVAPDFFSIWISENRNFQQ